MKILTKKLMVEALARAAGDALIIVGDRPVVGISLASGWLVDAYFSKAFVTGDSSSKTRVRARAIQFAPAPDGATGPRMTKDEMLGQIADMPDDAVVVVDGYTVEGVSLSTGWVEDAGFGLRFSTSKPRSKSRERATAVRFTTQTEDSAGAVYTTTA